MRALALATLLLAGVWSPARAGCRLALVLGMDVSASVDAREYALMMRGTAGALVAPPVAAAFLSAQPVALAAFVWSGAREQAVVADWSLIDSQEALERFAAQVAAFPRPNGDPLGSWGGRTAVGAALISALGLLQRAPACDAQTIDLAGDGTNNDGPEPAPLRSAMLDGVTVNALAVSGDLPLDHGTFATEGGQLSAWLAANVLHGPGAFVESALDYDDFERAMTCKLLRELLPPLMGQIPPRHARPANAG